MKKIYALIALLAGISSTGFCNGSASASERDSIIILFGKKTQIVIQSQDREELKKLKNFDFNDLISQVIAVTEATQHTSSAAKDTSFVVNGDTIVMKGNEVVVKDNEDSNKVTFSIRIGKETDETSKVEIKEEDSTVVIIRSRTTPKIRVKSEREERRRNRRTDKEFVLDLGLNNYLENGQFPDENNAVYGLRPLGSRYIALGYQFQTRIGSRKSPLSINYGLELSANNFMFDTDARIRKSDTQVTFEETNLDLKKNKLTVLYISLPVMPMLHFGNNNFRIGAGGFVGYRMHSYSKIMYFEDGKRKDHEQSNYNLSNFRYGLVAQVGFKGINLFAKYDLNPLFTPGKGPSINNDLHALSFGIRL